MSLLLGAGCLIVVWLELKLTWRWFSTFRAIRNTKEGSIEELAAAKLGSLIEFNASPLEIPSRSPVKNSACAAWEFEIWQVKVDRQHGNSTMVPVIVQTSEPRWLLFETATQYVGVRFDSSVAEMSQNFELQSVFSTSLPPELERYLGSHAFKAGVSKLNNLLALESAASTSFRENVIPAHQPLHVFGRVDSLLEEQIKELKSYSGQLGLQKPISPYTVGGDELSLGYKNENNLLARTRRKWLGHAGATLVVLGFAGLFLYQYIDAF